MAKFTAYYQLMVRDEESGRTLMLTFIEESPLHEAKRELRRQGFDVSVMGPYRLERTAADALETARAWNL